MDDQSVWLTIGVLAILATIALLYASYNTHLIAVRRGEGGARGMTFLDCAALCTIVSLIVVPQIGEVNTALGISLLVGLWAVDTVTAAAAGWWHHRSGAGRTPSGPGDDNSPHRSSWTKL